MEAESSADREALLLSLKKVKQLLVRSKILLTTVHSVDLGGIDGLLHITDMAWKRIKHTIRSC